MEEQDKKPVYDKNILDLFWKLSEKNPDIRIKACTKIIHSLLRIQCRSELDSSDGLCKDLEYSVERLVKGLASSREAARLGYSLLLTEIMKQFDVVKVERILELIKEHLSNVANQDKRDIIFGQFFAYAAIARSGRLIDHSQLSFVVISLYELCIGRSYLLNACYEIFKSLFSKISSQSFKDNVWPHLKEKLPSKWDECDADSFWLLLLCQRLFSDAIDSKYLKKHWRNEDIFSADNLSHHRRLIKTTTASLPALHPLCLEFLEHIKERKDAKQIWYSVVDENLFDEQKEKAFVGFEMIKRILKDNPRRKMVKYVLSPKFCSSFVRSYMNYRNPMHAAANHLGMYLSEFAKEHSNPSVQIYILNVFLQLPGNYVLAHLLKKKEVSLIIQNLLPEAIKAFYDLLKIVAVTNKSSTEESDESSTKCFQSIMQIGNLVSHPMVIIDMEWRMHVIKFLFLRSFFTVKVSTTDIEHCDVTYSKQPDSVCESFTNSFYKALYSLHHKIDSQSASIKTFLDQLLLLSEYAEQLLCAKEYVSPLCSLEKIQETWNSAKSMIHKLSQQDKEDGRSKESNAFQSLFLQLSFRLFHDPEHTAEVIEELHICCEKALKHDDEISSSQDDEPPWISVVIDILLSFLSKPSHPLRCLVISVFPLLCPFITQEALQQILDVINTEKGDESILVEESDEEGSNLDFNSGSSDESNSSDAEAVDEEFKAKVKDALGPVADKSDDESVVLTDSEMFKVDEALSKAFKARINTGHTKLSLEDKTLLHFRIKCLDLIIAYFKSEPPMQLVLQCIEPLVIAFEHGHRKLQKQLLYKAVSTLQTMTKIKKFQHHNGVEESELKRILEILVAKCHKEKLRTVANPLYSLCIFVVLCFRKLNLNSSPEMQENSSNLSYMKIYLVALERFAKESKCTLYPHFFTLLMEACPDLAWNFVEPCQNYAFDNNPRIYKKTQCLGLLLEAMKFAKKCISPDQWLQYGQKIIPRAVEALKTIGSNPVNPVYLIELLNVIHTTHVIVEEKTSQLLLKQYVELIHLLNNLNTNVLKKLTKKGNLIRRKIVLCLGGEITKRKFLPNEKLGNSENEEGKSLSVENLNSTNGIHDSESNEGKRKSKTKNKKNKKKLKLENLNSTNGMHDSETNEGKRKSKPKKKKNKKKLKLENSVVNVQ